MFIELVTAFVALLLVLAMCTLGRNEGFFRGCWLLGTCYIALRLADAVWVPVRAALYQPDKPGAVGKLSSIPISFFLGFGVVLVAGIIVTRLCAPRRVLMPDPLDRWGGELMCGLAGVLLCLAVAQPVLFLPALKEKVPVVMAIAQMLLGMLGQGKLL